LQPLVAQVSSNALVGSGACSGADSWIGPVDDDCATEICENGPGGLDSSAVWSSMEAWPIATLALLLAHVFFLNSPRPSQRPSALVQHPASSPIVVVEPEPRLLHDLLLQCGPINQVHVLLEKGELHVVVDEVRHGSCRPRLGEKGNNGEIEDIELVLAELARRAEGWRSR